MCGSDYIKISSLTISPGRRSVAAQGEGRSVRNYSVVMELWFVALGMFWNSMELVASCITLTNVLSNTGSFIVIRAVDINFTSINYIFKTLLKH